MNIRPDTPVFVEWWVHTRIPSTHHAFVCSYAQALQWYEQGAIMTCFTVDGNLLEELFDERRPKAY